ncbi:MAG: tetratricopeptide repeat protein [Planctomycetes bacterium]|nr:tetratricopeptide repeat protein [Planctomycetota bacterium]
MRRVLLILIILGVLGGLALAIAWYLHQGTTAKLLARSELAMRGQQYDRAMELADAVIAKEPANWMGHYQRAQACLHLGRYDEARASLGEAAKHGPTGVTVELAVAETHAMPARQSLASAESPVSVASLTQAISGLRQANDFLAGVQARDETDVLDLRQAAGLNLILIGSAQRALSNRLDKEADVAEVARDLKTRDAKRQAAQDALAQSNASVGAAVDVLLDVVKRDPKRGAAARALVEQCISRNDRQMLAAVRQAIMSQADPPVVAAVLLIMHDAHAADDTRTTAEDAQRLQGAARELDAILGRHPKDIEAKLARAETALRLSDFARAQALCEEVIEAKPAQDQQGRARFINARVLMALNKWADAERAMLALKTESPGLAAAHYAYAIAALATGKKELAREAMRTVTKLDPAHAGARRYLAESLLAGGFAPEAFPDAKAYYDAHPEDPVALGLYVRAAEGTGQTGLAQQAIEKALKDHPSRADMLLAVYDGYSLLGIRDKAADAARRAADCKPANLVERLAVARALVLTDRVSEAEKLLGDELARDPKDARLHFELARLYASTDRAFQAIEEYRTAADLDEHNMTYQEVLARALFDAGLLDECLSQCQAILGRDPSNTLAPRLISQVRLIRGEINIEEMLRQAGPEAPAGLYLAQIYLSNGLPGRCVEICEAILKKKPNDADARVLLGQAYLVLGQDDKCIEQWAALVKASPDQLTAYLRLAVVLARRSKPEQVQTALAAVPGARQDMVDMAMGWLFDRLGRVDAAADAYGRLAGRKGAPEQSQNLARLFRAQALARGGRVDRALAELDLLAASRPWQRQALLGKAQLLAASDRGKEAAAVLADLQKIAAESQSGRMWEQIAALHVQIRQIDEALAACDRLQELLPYHVRSYLMRAAVLSDAGKLQDAAECYRKAIERQPGNFRIHLLLARTLDADGKPLLAVEALKRLETMGQTGRAIALFEQGDMFTRWGVQADAAACFEQLAKLGYAGDPRLQRALGHAFACLGMKDRAREILEKIPEYASQYVSARQALADLEDTDEAKLQVLGSIDRAKPGRPSVLVQEMSILLLAKRPADAVKRYQDFIAQQPAGEPLADEAPFLASQALLTANNLAGAADLVLQMAEDTQRPRWRQLAALLLAEDRPEVAKAQLPPVGEAGIYEALLGLAVASHTGGATAPWKDRLAQIQQSAGQTTPAPPLPAAYKVLAALASGSKAEAEAELAKVPAITGVSRGVAAELVAAAGRDPKAPQEAARLLRAALAADQGIPLLAQKWAMQALKARPTCQWAAALVMQTRPDAAMSQEVLGTLQPGDCPLARTIQAALAFNDKQYDKAAEIWAAVAQADSGHRHESLMNQGLALEKAGRLAEALPLYRQVWEATQNPAAANNAAYLTTQLHAQDAAMLADAQKWAEAAVKASPQTAAFRDTLGWIAHLRGRHDEASAELWRAVKGLPDSPEVHYHLGAVEAAIGRKELARWHLAAAVSLGEKQKAGDKTVAVGVTEAVRSAREALAKMEQPKS